MGVQILEIDKSGIIALTQEVESTVIGEGVKTYLAWPVWLNG